MTRNLLPYVPDTLLKSNSYGCLNSFKYLLNKTLKALVAALPVDNSLKSGKAPPPGLQLGTGTQQAERTEKR